MFALSTHLFHTERLTRGHIEAIAAAGWPAVEVFATKSHLDYHDAAAVDALAAWLTARGLHAPSMHAPICDRFLAHGWGRAYSTAAADRARRLEAVAETTAALDAAVRLDCGILVLHLGVPAGQAPPAGDNDADAARRSIETIAGLAHARGVRLALEVMPNALSTPEALVQVLEGDVELPGAGICLDLGHAHLMGDVADAIEAVAGHVIATHLHDNRRKSDDHLVPFQGSINWSEALMTLQKIGYPGALTFEVADQGDAASSLAKAVGARTRLQAILDDLTTPMTFEDA